MALGDLAPASPSTSTEAGGPPAGLQAQAASGPLHTISAPRVFSGWLLFMTSPLPPPTHRTWVPRPPHLKASAPQSPSQSLPHVPAVSFMVLLTTGATASTCVCICPLHQNVSCRRGSPSFHHTVGALHLLQVARGSFSLLKFTIIPTPSTGLGMKDAQCSTSNRGNEWVDAGSHKTSTQWPNSAPSRKTGVASWTLENSQGLATQSQAKCPRQTQPPGPPQGPVATRGLVGRGSVALGTRYFPPPRAAQQMDTKWS